MTITCEKELQRKKSENIYSNSCQKIPGGVNSPVRAFQDILSTPLVAERGCGDTIVDADGNTFIDYCCSWGALIHGHAHPEIVRAAQDKLLKGSSFGITTEIEAQLAEKITTLVPAIEKVRFVSSGTEATMSAVRLARAFTEREYILKFSGNYHGHADYFLVQAGSGVATLPSSSSAGVPKDLIKHTICIPYNNFSALEETFKTFKGKIACVIVEPIAANMGLVPPLPGFLELLRQKTLEDGALLIFDEVITGFRVALGGAAELYGITPDLICLGKIVGGGFPAAAFGGRAEIMNRLSPLGNVYQAGTLSGCPVAMAAGLASLSLCERPGFYQELEQKACFLIEPIEKLVHENALDMAVQRQGSLFTLFFGKKRVDNFSDAKMCNLEMFKTFFKDLLEAGVYFSPSQFEANFLSYVHTRENIERTQQIVLKSIKNLFSLT